MDILAPCALLLPGWVPMAMKGHRGSEGDHFFPAPAAVGYCCHGLVGLLPSRGRFWGEKKSLRWLLVASALGHLSVSAGSLRPAPRVLRKGKCGPPSTGMPLTNLPLLAPHVFTEFISQAFAEHQEYALP